MLPASEGDADLDQALLSRSAVVSGKYVETGHKVLMLAKEHGCDEIVHLLKSAGAKE
jgi:ankyrin repeat protein